MLSMAGRRSARAVRTRVERSAWALRATASVLAMWCTAGIAAQVPPDEYERLTREAQVRGAVRVLIALDAGASLDAIARRRTALRAAAEQKAQVLYAELGANAWEAGRWSNGLGQVGAYVTPAGLKVLAATSNAVSFGADPTHKYRLRSTEADGSHQAIEAALAAQGHADVEVVLNTDEGEPELEQNGAVKFKPSRALADEVQARLGRINAQRWAHRLTNVDGTALAQEATFKARIDREAFAALRESDEVRAVKPVGFVDARPARWSKDVLDEARAKGSADVIITLRGGRTFSPKSGDMSAKAWKAQGRAHARIFAALLGPDAAAAQQSEEHAALGSIHLRLSASVLERLFAQADPRILDVNLNRPVAFPALVNSTELMNMASAWNVGHRAVGQSIVIMDSGIRKDHALFKRADGSSKVYYEACFGSNTSGYASYCPSSNALGDSPLGLKGSGEPISAPLCALPKASCGHGTHVAGIAAARAHPTVRSGALQGVAPDADLISAQVFSYVPSTGAAGAFSADMVAALNAVFSATVPGLNNPYVVNMSIGSSEFKEDCPSYYPDMTNAVLNLVSRGVPVVVATGNNSFPNAIGFPACVPQTIKVSSVANDSSGTSIATFANIAAPEGFTGPVLFAPGGSETTLVASASYTSSTDLWLSAGTSMATPHVAGLYAAIKAASPGISVADATAWIVSTGSIGISVSRPATFGTRTFRRVRLPNF